MPEIIINLHMHTTYSDGYGSHQDIARAAIKAGIDAVIVTDHNVLVNGVESIITENGKNVLLLVGEEVHDQARQPQKSHLLVIGAYREVAHLAYNLPLLLENVRQANGLSIIAHPYDPEALSVGESDISWMDWDVNHINGIELWNGLSEYKSLLKSKFHAIYYAYNPNRIAHGPPPQVLKKWDEMLIAGKRIIAIGGSDAHELRIKSGTN